MKKLRCTKNLIKMQKEATTKCWEQTVETYSRKLRRIAKQNGEKLTAHDINVLIKTMYRDEVDQLYRKNICKLPTETIEAILYCWSKGRFQRAPITIAALKTELANRILLGDSGNRKEISETKNQ